MKKKKALKIIIKTFIITVALIGIAMFVIPIMFNILNIGNILGTALCLLVIAVVIRFDKLSDLCKEIWKKKSGKAVLSILCVILIAGIVSFSAILGSVIYEAEGHNDNQQTIIVLGCAVRGDVASITLRSRVNTAYRYMNKNPECVAVLSGGQGKNENISEAECMYSMLTEMGIDSSRLYKEDKSTSTETNIEYSKKIIEENNLGDDIAVVSSDYHLKRAKMICAEKGIDAGTISASSSIYDKPTFYLREVLGIVKEIIF